MTAHIKFIVFSFAASVAGAFGQTNGLAWFTIDGGGGVGSEVHGGRFW